MARTQEQLWRMGMRERASRDRRRRAQKTLKFSFAFFLRLVTLEFASARFCFQSQALGRFEGRFCQCFKGEHCFSHAAGRRSGFDHPITENLKTANTPFAKPFPLCQHLWNSPRDAQRDGAHQGVGMRASFLTLLLLSRRGLSNPLPGTTREL